MVSIDVIGATQLVIGLVGAVTTARKGIGLRAGLGQTKPG